MNDKIYFKKHKYKDDIILDKIELLNGSNINKINIPDDITHISGDAFYELENKHYNMINFSNNTKIKTISYNQKNPLKINNLYFAAKSKQPNVKILKFDMSISEIDCLNKTNIDINEIKEYHGSQFFKKQDIYGVSVAEKIFKNAEYRGYALSNKEKKILDFSGQLRKKQEENYIEKHHAIYGINDYAMELKKEIYSNEIIIESTVNSILTNAFSNLEERHIKIMNPYVHILDEGLKGIIDLNVIKFNVNVETTNISPHCFGFDDNAFNKYSQLIEKIENERVINNNKLLKMEKLDQLKHESKQKIVSIIPMLTEEYTELELTEAIDDTPTIIRFIDTKKQTENMQIAAISTNPAAINYIDKPLYKTQLTFANNEDLDATKALEILVKKKDIVLYEQVLTTFAKRDPDCMKVFKSPPQCMLDTITTNNKKDYKYDR